MISRRYSGDATAAVFVVIMIVFWIAAAVGWILNIAKIFHAAADPITAIFIVRCVGAFVFPIGVVLGYF